MGAKSILLVEDNPDDLELARRALNQVGYGDALVVARDGVEALDYLNSYVCKPVEFSRFTTALSEIGRYWIDLNTPPQP